MHELMVFIYFILTLESLLAEVCVLKHSAEVGEVHQSVVPSHHVGEAFPELWVKHLWTKTQRGCHYLTSCHTEGMAFSELTFGVCDHSALSVG